jgi:uncharacterized protein
VTAGVEFRWGVKIPLRDGVALNGILYLPRDTNARRPAICTLTPYIAQTFHEQGVYFASRGFPFLTVDVRGRGNSEGLFKPNINEAKDGYDVVEWLAQQEYCDGKVAMWGGSYAGYSQWAAAKEFPPHLATIAPAASPFLGVDFPMRGNIGSPYWMRWLTFVAGTASQEIIFYDDSYWNERFAELFKSGISFCSFDERLGMPSATFQEWCGHPHQDEYWDAYNPTAEQYARLEIPILTITGIYDGNQPGALMHHQSHATRTSATARSKHYLVIGPWDHAGTRTPALEFCGIKVGRASLVDLPALHCEWYAWTMQGGPRPTFLQRNVAYYVMEADRWRYADTLDAVTARFEALYLHSMGNPTDVFKSGSLKAELPPPSEPDHYVYDPRDLSPAKCEGVEPESLVNHYQLHASAGKHLVYHSDPFAEDTEIAGFFRLSVWLSIDQRDTDFRVCIYDVRPDGTAVLLTADWLRARYRESLRAPQLIETTAPLRFEFKRFTFVAKVMKKGSRLRLVVGPSNSIYTQKNYNSGGIVSKETMREAQPVTVSLFHDSSHPSALYVPIGCADGQAPH